MLYYLPVIAKIAGSMHPLYTGVLHERVGVIGNKARKAVASLTGSQ